MFCVVKGKWTQRSVGLHKGKVKGVTTVEACISAQVAGFIVLELWEVEVGDERELGIIQIGQV